MRISYPTLLLLSLSLSACAQNGGVLPISNKDLLSTFDGPKIPSMQDGQIDEAKNAEKIGDYEKSIQIYQQILEKSPDDKGVTLSLADNFRRSGEYDKAISVYDSLITKDATNISAKEGKAIALISKGDFETPTQLLDDVLKTDGKRWKSLNAMGILFVTRGLQPEAQQYFEEALKNSPNNLAIMNNLALSKALSKDFNTAIEILTKASAQSKVESVERKRIDLNLALVYATAGKLEDAKKIAEIYLKDSQLNNNLGLYAHLAKDDKLAKSYLNMALTESKTYYSKAWENLESLNANSEDNRGEKSISKNLEKPVEKPTKKTANKAAEKLEKTTTKKSKASTKDESNQQPATLVNKEPVAVKSEVKSLGKIKIDDLNSASKPVEIVTPVGVKPVEIKLEEVKPTEVKPTETISPISAPTTQETLPVILLNKDEKLNDKTTAPALIELPPTITAPQK